MQHHQRAVPCWTAWYVLLLQPGRARAAWRIAFARHRRGAGAACAEERVLVSAYTVVTRRGRRVCVQTGERAVCACGLERMQADRAWHGMTKGRGGGGVGGVCVWGGGGGPGVRGAHMVE